MVGGGSDGDLACLDAASGKVQWQKSLRTDFGGKPGAKGLSGLVLIDGLHGAEEEANELAEQTGTAVEQGKQVVRAALTMTKVAYRDNQTTAITAGDEEVVVPDCPTVDPPANARPATR